MANGKIRFGKQSGGELALVIPDGVSNTEVIIPESGELVNKDYVDLKVALKDFIGTNVNLAENGYHKLPSGLIIQWFVYYPVSPGNSYKVLNLPIAFPNGCFAALGTAANATTAAPYIVDIGTRTTTTIAVKTSHAFDASVQILVIGY